VSASWCLGLGVFTTTADQPKKSKSSTSAPSSNAITTTTMTTTTPNRVQSARKKSGLKAKGTAKGGGDSSGPVLGDVDYVALMMGGRRKAREEASKLQAQSLG
jgi:hypothetical protein